MVEHDAERTPTLFIADAEKTRRLVAVARELGGVAIFNVKTFDPDSTLSLAEQRRQGGLDQPMYALLWSHGGQVPVATRFHLENRGVYTVRDVLAVGRSSLALTPKRKELIDRIFATDFPGEVLKDKPTPTDVAEVCHSLHQVTAVALPAYRVLRDRNYIPDSRGRVGDSAQRTRQRWTVADILSDPDRQMESALERVADMLRSNQQLKQACGELFARCHSEAIEFAAEFLAARQRLDEQHGPHTSPG